MLVNGSLFGGGAEHMIGTVARHLRAAGHEVMIAVIHRGGEVRRELEADGFDVVTNLARNARGFATSGHLNRLIEDRRIEIVHSHDLRSLVDASLCRLRSRRFSLVHTFHFGNYPHISRKQRLLETMFSRVPDQLVAVGNAQRDAILETLHLPAGRIRTVWNGVDYAAVADESPPRGHTPLLGSVSTFGEQKGLPTLLDAAHLLRLRGLHFRLMLVGDGPLRAELEARTANLGLTDCVEFTGWQPDAAVSLLPTFDLFVQSSLWEAMSVVILEAMAARRAIVATTVGENASVLIDGESALLVPPGDAEALADAMASAITDPALRSRLGERAHADYRARFTGSAMGARYEELYVSLRPSTAEVHQ